jgi:hypothetical protein
VKNVLASLKPVGPAIFYTLGLAAFVVAGFLAATIIGLIALGASLMAIGYMVEVNQ